MKHILLSLLALSCAAFAGIKAGPRHGRMLELQNQSAEFLVEKDRTISIAFYDESGKQQPAGEQIITAIAEIPETPARIEFEKKGDLLVSKAPLPAGEGYQIVLQIRSGVGVRPKNFRIKLETHICGGCQYPEYACTCHE